MLAAVEFDNQLGLKADEIHDIRSHRLLSAEFKSVKPATAQRIPKFALNNGLIAAKLAGEIMFHDTPHPSGFVLRTSPDTLSHKGRGKVALGV